MRSYVSKFLEYVAHLVSDLRVSRVFARGGGLVAPPPGAARRVALPTIAYTRRTVPPCRRAAQRPTKSERPRTRRSNKRVCRSDQRTEPPNCRCAGRRRWRWRSSCCDPHDCRRPQRLLRAQPPLHWRATICEPLAGHHFFSAFTISATAASQRRSGRAFRIFPTRCCKLSGASMSSSSSSSSISSKASCRRRPLFMPT